MILGISFLLIISCINVGREIQPSSSISGEKNKCNYKEFIQNNKIIKKIYCSEKYKITAIQGYDTKNCKIERHRTNFTINSNKLFLICRDFNNEKNIYIY